MSPPGVATVKVRRLPNPLGTVNVCVNFYENPSNACWDISVWTKVLDQITDWPTLQSDNAIPAVVLLI